MTEQAPNAGQEKALADAPASYDELFKPDAGVPDPTNTAEAGVRPVSRAESHPAETDADQMMSLHRADRANRADAKLPPRVLDLR